ncbi:PilZ domain-containing protein [Gilvimarinus sp. DA14]|uniref:PilZ domain-containing protein n=1 Tax=Gilvimarinus sp. DA14 TaxID=2956798 RepID=UPI0020B8C7AA|nr:PilZ domain-containing protein [Gilvimarinus sp. DA14]UTF61166.1 PilZ domain-containing protein [Gilvimarinus sp. DA14]
MGISDQSYEEKRDFIRMKIDAPLQARLTGDAGTYTGTCTELSGGGMQVVLDTALQEGSEWEVDISSEHGHSPQLRAIVKVVRVQADGKDYPTGLQIIDVIN